MVYIEYWLIFLDKKYALVICTLILLFLLPPNKKKFNTFQWFRSFTVPLNAWHACSGYCMTGMMSSVWKYHRHGGGEWKGRWWINWNTALHWYGCDGAVSWKRENWERMGQTDFLYWFQWLQDNSSVGFKVSHWDLPITTSYEMWYIGEGPALSSIKAHSPLHKPKNNI